MGYKHRFWSLLLPFGLLVFSASASLADSCPEASKYLKAIRASYGARDVSKEIQQFKQAAAACKLTLADFKVSKSKLKQWEHQGHQAAFEKLLKTVKRTSRFRGVQQEVSQLRVFAQALGKLNEDFDSRMSNYMLAGFESEIRERASCGKTVDLRGPKLGPVHNQGDLGWCFAYAASDLLSFETGQRISAADLTLNHQDSWIKTVMKQFGFFKYEVTHGGSEKRAILSALETGLCLEENFPSEGATFQQWREALIHLEKLKATARSLTAESSSSNTCTLNPVKDIFPDLPFSTLLKILSEDSDQEPLRTAADTACYPRIKPTGLSVEHIALPSVGDPAAFDILNRQLEADSIAAIGYDARVLGNHNFSGAPRANHSSTVVGKRFNPATHACEYLIRNSYGTDCNRYDPAYAPCEEGNVWVTKQALSRAIYDVTYISRAGNAQPKR